MPFAVTMPKLSPTMEKGTLVKWHKKVGDLVRAGDSLFDVATDKATVEHTALDEGYLRRIFIEEGKEAHINQPVALFTETANENIDTYSLPKEPDLIAPPEQEHIQAPPKEVLIQECRQPLFAPEPPLHNYHFPKATQDAYVRASPLAKKLAKEKGIDLTTVRGSGPRGRITSHDLDLGQKTALVQFGSTQTPKEAPGSYTEETLTPIRKVIAKRLQESKAFIPHFYLFQEVGADALVATRYQLKQGGISVSINDLVIRATALALKEHPHVNSGFHSGNNTIVRYQTIDIAVAVSMPTGLITPIIRHANYKNLGLISAEMRSLAERARAAKLAREEYVGGSFTISNLGMYGIDSFAGIINPPHGAILCVGGIIDKPIVKDAIVVPAKRMELTLCADHRVVDGADAAKFIKTLQTLLENPSLLLIA